MQKMKNKRQSLWIILKCTGWLQGW